MHHTKIDEEQYVNHNGGWDGDLEFAEKPTLSDCFFVVIEATKSRALGLIEDGLCEEAAFTLNLLARLKELRRVCPEGR